jgi:hypothetical protein
MNPFRNQPGYETQDPSSIAAIEYNKYSGSQKVSEVGRRLTALQYIAGGVVAYTTNATTARVVAPGACLALYNNDTAVHSITLGESAAVALLAPGVTDSTGHVGIPCPPGEWTYLAVGTHPWIITDSALLLTYVIEDASTIGQEFVQNVAGQQ